MANFKNKIRHSISFFWVSLAVIIFLNHLICTLLYLAPKNPTTRLYKEYVSAYMFPFFTQRWLLFAPEPQTSQIKFIYRCEIHGKWTEWKDPTYELILRHQKNRFSYYGKEVYVFNAIARDLTEAEIIIRSPSDVEANKDLANAKRLFSTICLRDSSESSSFQFSVISLDAKNYSERMQPGFYGKMIKMDYPAIKI